MKTNTTMKTVVLLALGTIASSAYAAAPANSTIRNTAELTYTGLSTPLQASVDVTISLSPAATTLSAPANATAAENQSVSYSYTVTANSNGSDTYDLSSSLSLNNITGSPTVTFEQGGAPIAGNAITLGATAASAGAAAGTNTITAPSDGTADSSVNDLAAGDTVVIGGTVYTIASVTDDGTTATITLSSNLVAGVNAGDPIFEQQSFDAVIDDVGTVTTSGSPADITMDVTVTSQTDAAQTSTDQTVTTVAEVMFEKFVTNESNVNGSSPVGIDFNGDTVDDQNFYTTASGVTAVSGDILRYAIRVTAPAASSLTGVQFTDTIPAFTTYVAGSTELNGAGVADDAGPATPLIAGMAVNSPGEPAGTVNPGESAVVTFRVTVN